MKNRSAVAVLAAATLLAAPVLVAAAETYPGGAASPQELIQELRKAAADGDIAKMAEYMAPEDRAGMSFGLLLSVSMMAAMGGLAADMGQGMSDAFSEGMDDEDRAEADAQMEAARAKTEAMVTRLETVFTKYGVAEMMEDDSPMPGGADSMEALAESFKDVDQIGLIRELSAMMEELGEGGTQTNSFPEGDLEDLEIEGDQATGTLGGETLDFVRIGKRWFVRSPEGLGE